MSRRAALARAGADREVAVIAARHGKAFARKPYCLGTNPRGRADWNAGPGAIILGMGLAQQFGHPRGLLGAFVGRGMAKGNADLSRWVVQQVKSYTDTSALRVAELGPGPGIGLEALLLQFEQAHVWGVDLSSVMLSQSRRRNHEAVAAGRLTLIEGDTAALSGCQPADVVMANHVIYFWRDPAAEMSLIRGCLRPGGVLALGYQLRQNMPALAQKRFPPAGHRLYEKEDDLTQLATAAGFTSITSKIKGPADAPEGRVTLATA